MPLADDEFGSLSLSYSSKEKIVGPGKEKRMPLLWKYEELDLRDDVKLALPENWRLSVYKVTSGDSGKIYHVQQMFSSKGQVISLCNCSQGYFQLPLAVLGLKSPCKHADNLNEFLDEKRIK